MQRQILLFAQINKQPPAATLRTLRVALDDLKLAFGQLSMRLEQLQAPISHSSSSQNHRYILSSDVEVSWNGGTSKSVLMDVPFQTIHFNRGILMESSIWIISSIRSSHIITYKNIYHILSLTSSHQIWIILRGAPWSFQTPGRRGLLSAERRSLRHGQEDRGSGVLSDAGGWCGSHPFSYFVVQNYTYTCIYIYIYIDIVLYRFI